jgi:peptide deformylase
MKINDASKPEELPFLRTKGYTVVGISDDHRQLINHMAKLAMDTPNCVGLAANQVWDDPIMPPPAIFVIKMQDGALPFINPVLEQEWKRKTVLPEQCMSVPGKRVRVERPYHIRVRYLDGEGNERTDHFYDMMARIWLHEYDHVMGRLILDHGRPF